MKRRLLKFDQFLVFTFTMDKGERKVLKPEEVNRGLTTYGPNTLWSISVFTKGKFVSILPGHEPWYSGAGDGGSRFATCDTLAGHALVALEDGSEYHCILPRDETPRFWERDVYTIGKGAWPLLYPGCYCYVASGSIDGFPEKMIYNSSDTPIDLKSDGAIVAIMWIDDEPEVPA